MSIRISMPRLSYNGRREVCAVPGAPAVVMHQVHARYPGSERLALRDVSLRVEVGMRMALVGPNGAGKSTLLKALAGVMPITRGEIRIYGNPVGACHHRVAYLAQRGNIDWSFPISVRKLVLTGRYPHLGWLRLPMREDWRIADAALERVGLRDLAERQIGELSGGQQQRALVARALAQDADLLLLDEPLNAVDAQTREILIEVLKDLARHDKTALIATHDLDRMEDEFDDAIFLVDGAVVARGIPETSQRVRALMGAQEVWA